MSNTVQAFLFAPTVIEITGRDRVKWLHSFVTNEIRTLQSTAWCETFVTDNKGKSFSHGCVFLSEDKLYFLSVQPDQSADLVSLWDRYIISEDVTLKSVESEWVWFFVTTQDWERLPMLLHLQEAGVDGKEDSVFWRAPENSQEFVVGIQGFALGHEYVMVGVPKAIWDTAQSHFEFLPLARTQALAAENRFPWFGVDFGKDNLPQEVDRDALAISFKKGCYLGQETIARLDALGQVQKKLFSVCIEQDGAPVTPAPLYYKADDAKAEQTQAGVLTSAYPGITNTASSIGFAMVRRKYFDKVNQLYVESGGSLRLKG